MAEDITFVVHKEWLDSMANLPVEEQDKIIADLVRYGTEVELAHEDEPMVQTFVNLLKGRIDYSKDKYQQRVGGGVTNGRRKKVNDEDVLRLAREGKNATEIARILQCCKSTIDHSPGWKNRNKVVDSAAEGTEFIF